MSVLAVDDDPDFVGLLVDQLEHHAGWLTVESTTDPKAVIDRLPDPTIDCVVSDYDMPSYDGLSLLHRVRELDPDLPFILFTGKGSEEVAGEAISAGVTDYLQKQTGSEQYVILANRIRNAVEHRQAERQLTDHLDRMNDGFYALDSDWRFTYVNPKAAELLEHDRQFLRGEVIWEVFPDVVGTELAVTFREAMGTQVSQTVEYYADRIDRHLEATAHPFASGLSVYFSDISGRKHRERELEETKDWFGEILRHSSDFVLVIDHGGQVQYVSPAVTRVLGVEPADLEGKHADQLVHPDDRSNAWSLIGRVMDDESEVTEELRGHSSGGDWRWLEVRASNQLEDPVIGGILVDARDVTARKRREEAMRELHAAAEALFRAEDRDRVASLLVDVLAETLDMAINGVWFYDNVAEELRLAAWSDVGEELFDEPASFAPGESLSWEVFETGVPCRFEDVSMAPGRYNPDTSIRSEIIIPLGDHGIVMIGALEVGVFDEFDGFLAETVASHAATALDRIAQRAALARANSVRSKLLETLPVGTLAADGEGSIVAINHRMCELFDIDDPPRAWESRNLGELLTVAVAQCREPHTFRERLSTISESGDQVDDLDISLLDGRELTLNYGTLALPGSQGDLWVFTDTTERRRYQRQLERLQEHTNALMHTQSEEETAALAVEAATEDLGADVAGFHMLGEGGDVLEPVAFSDPNDLFDSPPVYDRTEARAPVDQFVWDVFTSGDTRYVPETAQISGLREETPVKSAVLYPLEQYGLFIVSDRGRGPVSDE